MFLPIFKVFSNLKTRGRTSMPTDDRFLPQGKQILTKICQVRPMPEEFGRTWETFSSLPAKKTRKFETATGKENF